MSKKHDVKVPELNQLLCIHKQALNQRICIMKTAAHARPSESPAVNRYGM